MQSAVRQTGWTLGSWLLCFESASGGCLWKPPNPLSPERHDWRRLCPMARFPDDPIGWRYYRASASGSYRRYTSV